MPIYRGRHLQADGQGVKGIPGESSHFRFDLSVYENVPVAGDNETR
jgi:hypothetical protein